MGFEEEKVTLAATEEEELGRVCRLPDREQQQQQQQQ